MYASTFALAAASALLPSVLGTDWTGPSWYLPVGTHITKLATTMKVPAIPPNDLDGQTLFVWPGIQPGNALQEDGGDPAAVGNGVLQPVLTYGPSCVPGDHPEDQWYISGVYVGGGGNPDFDGCFGGDVMQVAPEDLVACTMELKQGTASTWDQTCINLSNNNQTVTYELDLAGQLQSSGELMVENPTDQSNADWNFPCFFYNTVVITDKPMDASICVLPESDKAYKSKNSALSEDGLTCTLGGIAIFNPDKPAPEINDADLSI
ncbi:hypothetical protein K525DRAFT_195692 [Schizophyllum commune Loenen D]|nr:hypothetical protein K525DRAFT_195692 [Schizophyllum commune Loenen D]